MNGKKSWVALLVPLVGFLLAQLFAWVWWASSVNTKLERLPIIEKAINDGMADRYTGGDADRDLERQRKRDTDQDNRINTLHQGG